MRLWISILFISCDSDKGVTIFNTTPSANIISHEDGDEVLEGYPVEFRATLSDANHEVNQLTARWLAGGEEVCPNLPPDSSGETFCVLTINNDNAEVTVEVRDPDNASNTDSVNLNITPTEAPIAAIVSPTEFEIYYSDNPITFEGIIGDFEDDVSELTYEWSSSIDGTLNMGSVIVESDVTLPIKNRQMKYN
jgi:hypothetical protein